MRCFVVICFLATAVYADVSHLTGYNYERGSSVGSSGGLGLSSFGSGSIGGDSASLGDGSIGIGSGSLNGGLSGFSSGSLGAGSNGFSSGSLGAGSNGFSSGSLGGGLSGLSSGSLGGGLNGFSSGSLGSGSLGFNSGFSSSNVVHSEPAEVEFVKEFYTFDAPEEEYHEDENIQRIKESLKKSLQVVFIKTPETRNVERAALSLAKSASESNTAIYILQKQPDISHLSSELNLIHSHRANKPEVHFIKYRTPEDAANAQRAIQSQYESLGGSSEHKHGGVPHVLNYASHYAPAFNSHQLVTGGLQGASSGHIGAVTTGRAPSQTYLPA